MRFRGTGGSRGLRVGGLAAILGGLLWGPYGIFDMLQPWGTDTIYRDEVGYELILDACLYRIYSLPGGLALLLTSLGLLSLKGVARVPAGRLGKVGVILAWVSLVLSMLSVLGAVILFDPLFTGSRILGTLSLGVATLLIGLDAARVSTRTGWTAGLLALGLVGILLFPLWPLVYAVAWLSPGAGATVIALFGLGWMMAGYRAWSLTG